MRPVLNVVRGKPVPEALNSLNFLPQKVTDIIRLTVLSAVHNLMDLNQGDRVDETDLIIKDIRADQGPRFKRFRPVSRGRAHPILKRTCHLTVVVGTATGDEEIEIDDIVESEQA